MDQNQEAWVILAVRSLRFATEHPYAATGILGAALGSAVTYRIMTFNSLRETMSFVVTPKVYEVALSAKDLRRLLSDPNYELRWEMIEASVVVTGEKTETLKALPDIVYTETSDGEA